MKNAALALIMTTSIMLTGCFSTDSSTTGNVSTKKYDIEMTINNYGNDVTVTFPVSLTASTESSSEQETSNTASDTRKANLGYNGSTASMADDGAELFLESVTSAARRWIDSRKTDSENDNSVTSSEKQSDSEPVKIQKDSSKQPITEINYEFSNKFHHITTGYVDGGKSLALCNGDTTRFDKCESDGVDIPYHGLDEGRLLYWNMNKEPIGDIICVKDGKEYRYKAPEGITFGNCE